MALVTEMNLGLPATAREAANHVRSLEERVTQLTTDLGFYDERIRALDGVPQEGVRFIDDLTATYEQDKTTVRSRLLESLLPQIRTAVYELTNHQGTFTMRRGATAERLSNTRNDLTGAKMRFDMYADLPERVIRLDDVKAALRDYPVKQIQLKEASGERLLEMTFTNLVLTPMFVYNEQPPFLKNVDGGPFKIKIPPVRVSINLNYNKIKFKCLKAYRDQYVVGMSGYRVAHPHVVGRNDPCLGDWGMPLMETLDKADYAMTAELLLNVLQGAYDGDAAGVYWRKLLHSQLTGNATQTFLARPDPNVNKLMYHFWLCDRNGNVQRFVNEEPVWPDITIRSITAAPVIELADEPEILPDNDARADDEYQDQLYDDDGYNNAGYDREGYDRDGYDYEGYDVDGYNRYGYNEAGYDRDGYNEYGYDADGYDADGYDADGYDADGRDGDGWDCDGYDRRGYNRDGYDADGYDRNGYNRDGMNRFGRLREDAAA